MSDSSLTPASGPGGFLKGSALKSVGIATAGGLGYLLVSEGALDRWMPEGTSTGQYTKLQRGAAQAVGGLLVGGIVSRWSKPAAIGIAVSGTVSGAWKVAEHYQWDTRVSNWFLQNNSASGAYGYEPHQLGASNAQRVVFGRNQSRAYAYRNAAQAHNNREIHQWTVIQG